MEQLEEFVLEALDFDPDIACESKWASGEEATWLVTMTCCGFGKMLCNTHKEKTQRYNLANDAVCLNCSTPVERGKKMRFTPLDTRR